MIRTTVYLPEELHKALKLYGVENNQPMSEVIIEALKTIVFFNEKAKEAKSLTPFKQEVVEKLKDEYIKCEMPKCFSESQGKYRILTDQGESEKILNLCVFHWHQARKEGEVLEVE